MEVIMKKEYDIEKLNPRKNPYFKKLTISKYRIEKVKLSKSIMDELIKLSKLWKEEAISIGITPNTKKDFVGKDIYVSYNSNNKIVGYLLCSYFVENKEKPTIPSGSKVCFVDELYVMKRYRNKGIGRMLFNKMKQVRSQRLSGHGF